jgi:arsenate reductase-like glutaredoxin family protein
LLQAKGADLDLRDIGKDRLSFEELDQLIGDRDYKEFLNPRNELYRQRRMSQQPPTRDEALRWMAAEPNLIRRPVVIRGGRIVLGFDPVELEKMVR